MSIWQIILIVGWLAAVFIGRADLRVAMIMAANFAVTAAFPAHLGWVGIADIATIGALSVLGRRAQVIAGLYVLCAVVNAAGALGGLSTHTTYAILDPIGWVMLAVLGGLDSGIRRRLAALRDLIRRDGAGHTSVPSQRAFVSRNLSADIRAKK